MIALMMEAARTSETLVNLYQTTRCYNPEDSHLHTHRRENLKSYRLSSLTLLITWGRVLFKEVIVFNLIEKSPPPPYGTRSFVTVFPRYRQ
jgi:hypothetical protein